MYIDTHLHLSKSDYENIKDVVEAAKSVGVNYLIASCCTMNDIKEGVNELSIGLHPSEASIYCDNDLLEIENLVLKNRKKIVAIGEIGLDYHYGKEDIEKQKELFNKQLGIAEKYKLPVVIHSRDATQDTINILKKYNIKGVIHCFSGSLETAKIYVNMGFKLGIGGVVTFKNSNLINVIRNLSLSSLVLETDSPYLSPVPHRGEKNEPKNIPIIAKYISEHTKIKLDEIERETFYNACRVFDLKI